MVWRQPRCYLTLILATLALAAAGPTSAWGQAGVLIDPDGVLRMQTFHDPSGQLTRQRIAAAKAALDPELARPSKLRKVSLTRLESVIGRRLANSEGLTDEIKYLAGLTRIQYVFFFPDTNDIVIAGPAEGFFPDLSGRMVGVSSGRAVLELQDLVVALRAYPPAGDPTRVIGVSIDPTQEGLARMQQFLVRISGRVAPGDAGRIAEGLRESLGLQMVTFRGVSPHTHFAQVLAEADYRMKLIGIGLEQPPVNIASYVSRANPRDTARNALQRWYFTPNYECVRVSDDRMAMELVGDGVKLVGEDELVTADGGRIHRGRVDRASQMFVTSFTAKYPELARRSPVYAQLRNLIDMAIAAAFIQQQDYYSQIGWNMEVFGSEELLPVETYAAPKHAATAVNAIWKGNTLMTPVGGGVNIQPLEALSSDRLLADEHGRLDQARSGVAVDRLAEDQWWWD